MTATCTIDGCEKKRYGHGWCSAHYCRWRRNGDPLAGLGPKGQKRRCTVTGCEERERAKGLCREHYQERFKATRPPCAVEGCDEPANSRKLCPRHYQRLRKYGDPLAGPAFRRRRGEGLPKWAYWQRKDEQWRAATSDLLDYVTVLRADPCSYCDGPCEHIDHIVPVDSGGTLVVENVTAACGTCNVRKAATPLLHFMLKAA